MIIFQWPFVVVVNVKWCTKFIMIFFSCTYKKNEQESLCEKLKNQEREKKHCILFLWRICIFFLYFFSADMVLLFCSSFRRRRRRIEPKQQKLKKMNFSLLPQTDIQLSQSTIFALKDRVPEFCIWQSAFFHSFFTKTTTTTTKTLFLTRKTK